VPIQTRTIKVESKVGATVHNPLMVHDDPASDKLMVMLPGQGYSCNHPVLYYVRRMAIKLGFDVLSVEYGFQAAHLELDAQATAALHDDVWQAVKPVLEQGYRQVCVVGKSLGTPLAAGLATALKVEDISLILLTPIGGAFQGLDTIRTLAVMGTDDPLYSPEVVASVPNVEWQVFDGLNHSLEVKGDWKASIAALDRVISACEAFVRH
jgi:hypothetical protein